MALIECKKCLEVISNKGKACPKCGVPIKKELSVLAWVFILGVPALILFTVFSPSEKVVSGKSWRTMAHADVERHFKSDKEGAAKDAVWANSGLLRIGVYDDGTRRDGYAQYACEVLRDYKIYKAKVIINDVVKVRNSNKWITLGKATCK